MTFPVYQSWLGSGNENLITAEATDAIHKIVHEMTRPSVLFRPAVSLDGNMYCCLYGDNPQDGVAAFGSTPDEAARNFDATWLKGMEIRT